MHRDRCASHLLAEAEYEGGVDDATAVQKVERLVVNESLVRWGIGGDLALGALCCTHEYMSCTGNWLVYEIGRGSAQ
jgi:hypothetical protein